MATGSSLVTNRPTVEEEVPKWKLAREGIQLLINNRGDEAETLFKKYPDNIQMFAGYSFAIFMDALMTFEDDKLTIATSTLKEMERRCVTDTGWLKSMKSKVFGSDTALSAAENLESQIILADSQVCLALLTFLQQDLSGYFKGGWILRKSWKIYQHTYTEIRNLYKEIVGELPDTVVCRTRSSSNMDDSDLGATSDSSCEWEFDEPTFSSTSPSNGYIQHSHPYSPKISHSYTTSFDEKQDIYKNFSKLPKDSNFKCNCKCSCSISNNNSCSSVSGMNNSCNAATVSCNHTPVKCDDFSQASSLENGCANVTNSDLNKGNSKLSRANVVRSPSGKINAKNSSGSLSRVNSFLKKSTSVSSGLSKRSEKNHKPNGVFSQLSPFNSNLSLSYFTSTFNIFSEKQKCHDIDKETISRLMSAVSFGFGLFHLGISLLPPSLLRITHFLGFGGNRQVGISNLMYARLGTDMRAPLATLSLLWYHTIVRPFYALDGSNVQAGVKAATELLDESEKEYKDSGLFLFFKGRVHRLNSNIVAALQAFQASVDNSTQREIKVLSLHEVGWCHLIQLDYPEAEHTFQLLKLSSRWSRSFYAYLAMICSGSCNNLRDFSNLRDLKSLVEGGPRGSQLEVFLQRRFRCCPQSEEDMVKVDVKFWKVFVYELLYLWNTLPSCSGEDIMSIVADCEMIMGGEVEEPMLGLSKLIQGSCYCILKQYENGIASFRQCLDLRETKESNSEDAHVSAFAQYELGTLLIKKPETKEEGKTLLNQMATYKDYDFEQRLTLPFLNYVQNNLNPYRSPRLDQFRLANLQQHSRPDENKEILEWNKATDIATFQFYALIYAPQWEKREHRDKTAST